jgi:hypothetical protein
MDPVRRGGLQLIGGVDLGGELPCLLRGTLQTESLVPVPAAGPAATGVPAVAGGLGRDAAFQGVGVELEDEHTSGGAVIGVHYDEAGADGFGDVGVAGHVFSPPVRP